MKSIWTHNTGYSDIMYCTSNRTYVEAHKNIWEPIILGFQMQVDSNESEEAEALSHEADVDDTSTPSEPPNIDRKQNEDEENDSTFNAPYEQPNVDRKQVDADSASRSFCSRFSLTENEGADEGADEGANQLMLHCN
jgi:hypothetical protein